MDKPEINPIQPDRDQDVTGHQLRSGRADAESPEGDDDVEGHAARSNR